MAPSFAYAPRVLISPALSPSSTFHVTSLEGAPLTVAAKSAPLPATTFAVTGNMVISTLAGFAPADTDERSIHTMPPTASNATITAPISTGEILLRRVPTSAESGGAANGTDAYETAVGTSVALVGTSTYGERAAGAGLTGSGSLTSAGS